MNRRGFLKSLGLALGVAVAPQVLLSRAPDAFKWKRASSGVWVLNPEWVNAPYEIGYWIVEPGKLMPIIYNKALFENMDKCPIRLNKDGKIVPVVMEV